ncbi:MAG: NAD(P)/FAD-dependent oxidoreductase [Acetobacteraceae bacterium]
MIVGGGAAGLTLATRLAGMPDRRTAEVTLVDPSRAHLWKPLLHEAAAGTLRPRQDFLLYAAQAKRRHFAFHHARMDGLDRARRELWLAPPDDSGGIAPPRRSIHYDTLVIAVGSVADDFGVPGAAEHAFFIDTAEQAQRMQQRLLLACLRAQNERHAEPEAGVAVAIVGAGVIGVELAAELRRAANALLAYGFDRLTAERGVRITLLEAQERVLPALPRRVSEAAARRLARLGVTIVCGERVTRVSHEGVETARGLGVPAEIRVWAGGIKAPDFLTSLGGLETNEANQLVVTPDLRTTHDPDIFAIGDCAAAPWPTHREGVPPTAEAAFQQAAALAETLARAGRGEVALAFSYKDRASLAALGWSRLSKAASRLPGYAALEGCRARVAYRLLYKKHRIVVSGGFRVAIATLINLARPRTHSRLKLH